jgi:hypothetical protein
LVSAHWAESGPTADANADYGVDIFDINVISSNWKPNEGAAAVPEPAAIFLAAMGAAGFAAIKRFAP